MSLRRKKPKKEIMPWRKDITAHHRKKPTRADRAEFPAYVVQRLRREAGGLCQCGCGRKDNTTHHVMPRSRGGRGVYTNGMRVSGICHIRIQNSEEELQKWISVYEEKYGPYFWYDEMDWEEHKKRENLANRSKALSIDKLMPIVNLLASGAGRKLTEPELRFLVNSFQNRLDIDIFENLLREIVEGR